MVASQSKLIARPPTGSKCQEASPASRKNLFVPCGKPAVFIVRNRDPHQYTMCEACADHNVENRGAKIVKNGEKFKLADIAIVETAKASDAKTGGGANAKQPEEMMDIEAAPEATDSQIKTVSKLSQTQIEILAEMDKVAKRLSELNDLLKTNQEVDLPEAMTAAGMQNFTMTNGASVEIKKIVAASITKANQDAAFTWLEDNKHGDLIKRSYTIEFGKEDLAWAKKFEADMLKRKKKLKYKRKESVAPQTLGAFVREMDKEQIAVPEKLLGVFRLRKAIVTLPALDASTLSENIDI